MSLDRSLADAEASLDGGDAERAGGLAAQALEDCLAAGASERLAEVVRLMVAAGVSASALQSATQGLDALRLQVRSSGNVVAEARVLVALAELRNAALEAPEALQAVDDIRRLGDLGSEGADVQAQLLKAAATAHVLQESARPALEVSRSLLSLAQQRGDQELEASAWQSLASAHALEAETRTSAAGEALQAAQSALTLYRSLGKRRGEAQAAVAVARGWLLEQNAQQGLRSGVEALELWKSLGHSKGMVTALEIIIQAHSIQNDPMSGLRVANRELAALRRTGNRRGEADLLDMIAHTHGVLREPHSAIYHAKQALDVYWSLEDLTGQGWTLHTIAQMQRMQGEMAAASDTAQQALRTFQAAGNAAGESQAAGTLSTLLAERGMPEKAPRRPEALRGVKALVAAIEDRSVDRFKAAEATVDQLRSLLHDQDIAGPLQALLRRDDGAAEFLEAQGWDLGRSGDGEVSRGTGDGRPDGMRIRQWPHELTYLNSIMSGMNFGPQFRAVYPSRKGNPEVDNIEDVRPMCVAQLPDAENWQEELQYRPGVMDAALQVNAVLSFPDQSS